MVVQASGNQASHINQTLNQTIKQCTRNDTVQPNNDALSNKVNQPGFSPSMLVLTAIKTVTHFNLPNLGWPLKPFQGTGKREKKYHHLLKSFPKDISYAL